MSPKHSGSVPGPRRLARAPMPSREAGGLLRRQCTCGVHTPGGSECAECQRASREGGDVLRRRSAGPAVGTAVGPSELIPPIVRDVLAMPGRPLDRVTRVDFETRFGRDLSAVRLHDGPTAAASAESVGAAAFAVGRHVVFGAGRLDSRSAEGRGLLAHELAHVALHGGRGDEMPRAIAPPDSADEAQADRAAEAALRGGPAALGTGRPAPALLHRQLVSRELSGLDDAALEREHLRVQALLRRLYAVDASYAPTIEYFREIEAEIARRGLRVPATPKPAQQDVEPGAVRSFGKLSVEQRLVEMGRRIDNLWTGSDDEQDILDILSQTPASQAAELERRLQGERSPGKSWQAELDRVVDGENNLKLHQILSELHFKARGPKAYIEAQQTALVLPWHDVMGFIEDNAVFFAEITPQGKVRVKYPVRTLVAEGFGSEITNLPLNAFVGGLELDPDQAVIVHDYDAQKKVLLLARQLKGYQNAGTRKFLQDVGTIASFAIPVTPAASVAGRVFFITVERVLPALVLAVNESKKTLREWNSPWGARIIETSEVIERGLAIYGVVQFARSGYTLIRTFHGIVREARAAAAAARGEAAAERAEAVLAQLEKQAAELESEAAKARAAEVKAGATGEATPGTASESKATTAGGEPSDVTDANRAARRPAGPATADEPPVLRDVNPETRADLAARPAFRSRLAKYPKAAELLKLCESPCFLDLDYPEPLLRRLEQFVEEAERYGYDVNTKAIKRLLHQAETLEESKQGVEYLWRELDERKLRLGSPEAGQVRRDFELTAVEPSGPAPAPTSLQIRSRRGSAQGGEGLPDYSGRLFAPLSEAEKQALRAGEVAKVTRPPRLIPGQIARELRRRGPYKDWAHFRETFWKLVAEDSGLSRGWSASNLERMRAGWAPFVSEPFATGRGANIKLQLNHKVRIVDDPGGLYDLDNIEIVLPTAHQVLSDFAR